MNYICHNEDSVFGVGEHIPADTVDLVLTAPQERVAASDEEQEAIDAWNEAWLLHVNRALRLGGNCFLLGRRELLDYLKPIAVLSGLRFRTAFMLDDEKAIMLMYRDPVPFVRGMLKALQASARMTGRQIDEQFRMSGTGGTWYCFTGKSARLPSKAQWSVLQTVFDFGYPFEAFAPYYQSIQRGQLQKLMVSNPELFLETLITAGSREEDAVLDPFAGAGDVGAAALAAGRFFYGFEPEGAQYAKLIERLKEIDRQ